MAVKPDYILKILNKRNEKKNPNAGGGWLNNDGSISLILCEGIVLDADDETVYTLFPNDYKDK